jgi:hypothetical protein
VAVLQDTSRDENRVAADIPQVKAMPSTNFDKRIISPLDIHMIDIKERLDGHRSIRGEGTSNDCLPPEVSALLAFQGLEAGAAPWPRR